MKKNFWTARLKTILIVAVVLAVIVAVILGITSGASFGENVVGTILSPIRTGIAAIDRQAERYYNYIFGYEALKAENAELQKKILAMEEDVRTAEQYQRENEQLKTLLGLSEGTTASFRRISSRGTRRTTKAPLPSARARTRGWKRACAPSPRTGRSWV